MSAATIDRLLAAPRLHIDGLRKRRKGVGAAIRRSIPVRTFADWRDPAPALFEIDMVEHCGGPKTDGDYVHSLVLTDIASGWTECLAMRMRNQDVVIAGFDKAARDLLFPMLGVDSVNDSAFMNQGVFDYCKEHGLEQTRSRPYKKNDQAWVEQKHGSIVRRLVGYGRSSGAQATLALAERYASSRLYVNFFQPSFKLKSKTRDGACVHKVYFPPATPCDRVMAHARVSAVTKGKLAAQFLELDPVRLLQQIRQAQRVLCDLSAHGRSGCDLLQGSRCRNLPRELVDRVKGRRRSSHAPQAADGPTMVEDTCGSVRGCVDGHRGLAGRRAGDLRQRNDESGRRSDPGLLRPQGSAADDATARQGLASHARHGAGDRRPARAPVAAGRGLSDTASTVEATRAGHCAPGRPWT